MGVLLCYRPQAARFRLASFTDSDTHFLMASPMVLVKSKYDHVSLEFLVWNPRIGANGGHINGSFLFVSLCFLLISWPVNEFLLFVYLSSWLCFLMFKLVNCCFSYGLSKTTKIVVYHPLATKSNVKLNVLNFNSKRHYPVSFAHCVFWSVGHMRAEYWRNWPPGDAKMGAMSSRGDIGTKLE